MKKNHVVRMIIISAVLSIVFLWSGAGTLSAHAEEPRVSDGEITTFDNPANPFLFNYFNEKDTTEQLKLKVKGNVDYTVEEDGIVIKDKNSKVAAASFTIKKVYDFGTIPQPGEPGRKIVNRLRIDALSKYNTNTSIKIYLDEDTEPIIVKRLPRQKDTEDLSTVSPVFVEVPNDIYGQHYITVELSDVTTEKDKKTTVVLRSIKFYKESVPTVYVNIDEELGTIDAMNSDENHNTNCYGEISIKIPEGYKSPYLAEGAGEETAGVHKLEYIRGRGNSTWRAEKKPYKLKLDRNADLFGMGSNKHWALIANYYDNSLIRNRITYYLGDIMDMAYSMQLVPVDVVMNGKYLGSYYLSEVVRVDEERVHIKDMEKLTSAEISEDSHWDDGGYLIGMSPYGKEEGYQWKSGHGVSFVLESPEEMPNATEEDLKAAGKYIEGYINKTEKAIFGKDFKYDGNSYQNYLDLDSAVLYYLFQEFTKNGDAYSTASTKLYKDRGGKLYFGPLWDFDYVAWGSADYETPESYNDPGNKFPWFERLKQDPEFVARVNHFWYGEGENDENSLRYQILQLVADDGLITQFEQELASSADNNFDVPDITAFPFGGRNDDSGYIRDGAVDEGRLNGNDSADESEGEGDPEPDHNILSVCNNYPEEIARLRTWILKRIIYMDDYVDSVGVEEPDIRTELFYDGDELIAERYAYTDSPISPLPEPEAKEGYIFMGWYGKGTDYDMETGEAVEIQKKYSSGDYIEYRKELRLDAKWVSLDEYIAPENIYLTRPEIYMTTNEATTIGYTLLPENADQTVKFKSENPKIANVNGTGSIISSDKTGTTNIIITTPGGLEVKCPVHVVTPEEMNPIIYEFSFDKTDATLEKGDVEMMTYTYMPLEIAKVNIRVINPDPEIATMDETGLLRAKGAGETDIIVCILDSSFLKDIKIHVTVTDKNAPQPSPSPEPEPSPTATPTPTPTTAPTPTVTPTATPTVTPAASKVSEDMIIPKDTEFTYGNLRYMVLTPCKLTDGKLTGGTVQVCGFVKKQKNKATTLNIPEEVTLNQNAFKVVSIKDSAFKSSKKLKKAVIGANVTKVGKKAFYNCRKLKKIEFKGNSATIGASAVKNIKNKCTIKVPSGKTGAYKKSFNKKSGYKKSMKITDK